MRATSSGTSSVTLIRGVPGHSRQNLSNDTSCRGRRRACGVHLSKACCISEAQTSIGKSLIRAIFQGADQLLSIKRRKTNCL